MATYRERPYAQFRFQVTISDGPDATDARAGFQEISGLGIEVTVAEYRPGNYSENAPMKINTIYKVPDVTFKRGVLGDLDTFGTWIDSIRSGSQSDLRTVTIALQDEIGNDEPVQTWTLLNARPIKYTGPSLSGKGTDVAVEEFVVCCERIELS